MHPFRLGALVLSLGEKLSRVSSCAVTPSPDSSSLSTLLRLSKTRSRRTHSLKRFAAGAVERASPAALLAALELGRGACEGSPAARAADEAALELLRAMRAFDVAAARRVGRLRPELSRYAQKCAEALADPLAQLSHPKNSPTERAVCAAARSSVR